VKGASAASELIEDAFDGKAIQACVGPFDNEPSFSSQLLFSHRKIPQISYGADSSDLSNADTYEYFSRTFPSESYQGRALSKLIRRRFQWRHVSVFKSFDIRYSRIASEFDLNAGVNVMESVLLDDDIVDYTEYFRRSKIIGTRVFVMVMTPTDAAKFLVQGYEYGLFVPGTQVIGIEEPYIVQTYIWLF
jgi:hypothetical protein